MYRISTEAHFSSAHSLRDYPGKCASIHGHNWKVRLTVRTGSLDSSGMGMDFGQLRQILTDILDRFDHTDLNRVPPFDDQNPTAENLARTVFELVSAKLPSGVEADKVELWESDKNCVEYSAPQTSQ